MQDIMKTTLKRLLCYHNYHYSKNVIGEKVTYEAFRFNAELQCKKCNKKIIVTPKQLNSGYYRVTSSFIDSDNQSCKI
jgi:hypothetical protein